MRDSDLLRQYVEHGSQAAFAQIVSRHLRLVHNVCLRDLRDPALADDAAQAVFLILARKAPSLLAGTVLAGWLYATARFVSKDVLKQERRRRRREERVVQELARERPDLQADAARAEPLLNDALSALAAKDRAAVLLHLLEGHTLAETGAALGVSEDAARMRVSRAVQKMRRHLAGRGAAVSGAALAAVLASEAARAAPLTATALAQTSAAAAGGAGATSDLSQLTEGVMKAMKIAKLKAVAAVLAASCAGAGGVALAGRQYVKSHYAAVTPAGQAGPTTSRTPDTSSEQSRVTARLRAIRVIEGQTDQTPQDQKLPLYGQRILLEGLQRETYPSPGIARQKLQENPNDADAHRTLAESYGALHGQFLSELREGWAAVRCNPDNPSDMISLGSMLRYLDWTESVRLLSVVADGNYDDLCKNQAKNVLRAVKAQPVAPPRWLKYYGITASQLGPIQQEEQAQAAAFSLPSGPR